jgi:hypothetical protein
MNVGLKVVEDVNSLNVNGIDLSQFNEAYTIDGFRSGAELGFVLGPMLLDYMSQNFINLTDNNYNKLLSLTSNNNN